MSNWVTALTGASPQLKTSDRIEYGSIEDSEDRRFFTGLSPITHVGDVRELMVLHGANDPPDPVTEADQLVSAIRGAGWRGGIPALPRRSSSGRCGPRHHRSPDLRAE